MVSLYEGFDNTMLISGLGDPRDLFPVNKSEIFTDL